MRVFLLLILIFFLPLNLKAESNTESFDLCPLCSMSGDVICPGGFEPACESEVPYAIEPKCVFLENKYVPGCFKFIKVEKREIDFSGWKMPPGAMIEVIGGGETYTLNRETIGCRKL